jgi:hypothetical protein
MRQRLLESLAQLRSLRFPVACLLHQQHASSALPTLEMVGRLGCLLSLVQSFRMWPKETAQPMNCGGCAESRASGVTSAGGRGAGAGQFLLDTRGQAVQIGSAPLSVPTEMVPGGAASPKKTAQASLSVRLLWVRCCQKHAHAEKSVNAQERSCQNPVNGKQSDPAEVGPSLRTTRPLTMGWCPPRVRHSMESDQETREWAKYLSTERLEDFHHHRSHHT